MRLRISILFGLMLFLLSGCTLKQQVKGEYYLDSGKYEQGVAYFEEDFMKHPENPRTNYYLGRFYLAEGAYEKGLLHLKRAALLDQQSADNYFWLGIAHAANNQKDRERSSYLKALEIKSDHVQALTYLGHNYFEKAELEKALLTYDRVLKIWPDNPSALFNRALILKHEKRTTEEKLAWKRYLTVTASGTKARQTVENLNAAGDFDYRNYLIGRRIVTLKRIDFKPATPMIRKDTRRSLDVLGSVLENNQNIAIHVVAYQKNDRKLAEDRALAIKQYLLKNFSKIHPSRLKLSWFDVPENINTGETGHPYHVDESVNFITAIDQHKGKGFVAGRR